MADFIPTLTGVEFNLKEPHKDMVRIADIAYSLARTRRFNGHARGNCSVALHCVIVSHMIPEPYAIYGLLHDAHEAYTGDIVTPVKDFCKPGIPLLERKIDKVILEAFGLPKPPPMAKKLIRKADLAALLYEKIYYLPKTPTDWGVFEGIQPANVKEALSKYYSIESPSYHELLFLDRFNQLTM